MLQHHIIYKQQQELQQRQQLQGLGEVRNQDYLDQFSSLKHGSSTQFPVTVNLAHGHDPQMFMVGPMQMRQHGESNYVQGFHDGTAFSQGTNHGLGPMNLPQTEFGLSSYESSLMNNYKNINQHSHLQVPSNYSETILTKIDSSALGMHPSASPYSLTNQEYNFFMHQMSKSDDLLPPNEVFHEKNLNGHVSGQSFDSILLSDNGYQQGSVTRGNTSLVASELRHEDADSLDPLEQKILYNANDNIWDISFGRTSKMGEYESVVDSSPHMDGFPSMQSGSWSALMQSAVAETSSSKTRMQEEWSGVSFQNPEVSINDQPSNTMDSNNCQNDWLDRNLQNVSSPCSNHEHLVPESNMNNNFPHFQFGHLEHKGKSQSEASHFSDQNHSQNTSHLTDNNPQESRPTEANELISTSLLSPDQLPGQYKENRENDELQSSVISCTNDSQPDSSFSGNGRGTLLPSEGTYHVPAIKPFDQKMDHSNTVETIPAFLGSSVDPHVQNMIAHRNVGDVLKKDGISNDQAPEGHPLSKPWNALPVPQGLGFQQSPADPRATQLYSFNPSFSMGHSNSTASSSDNVKEHIQNKPIVSQATTMFPIHNAASPQINFQLKSTQSTGTQFPYADNTSDAQPSATSVALHHVGLRSILSQQQASSPKRGDFSTTNKFWSPASASEHSQQSIEHGQIVRDSSSRSGNTETFELKKERMLDESLVGMPNSTSVRRPSLQQELSGQHATDVDTIVAGSLTNQVHEQQHDDPTAQASDVSGYGHPLNQNRPQTHLMHSLKNAQTDLSKRFPLKYNITNYQRALISARELLLKGQMGPSLFNNNATLTTEVILSPNDLKSLTGAVQSISSGDVQENNLVVGLNSVDAGQGSGLWPSSASNLATSKESPSVLPLDVSHQSSAFLLPKKHKLVAVDMTPWHQEVCKQLSLQKISMAHVEWAVASNRRQEEAQDVAEAVEDIVPHVRAKRRLMMTTNIIQQVFRPPPAVILSTDASLNYDVMPYFSAKLAIADVCSHVNTLPAGTTHEGSPNIPNTRDKTRKRRFSPIVEDLISQRRKLEGELSRADGSLSMVDIRIENQEIEKFALLNRFAKFHMKANSAASAASSYGYRNLQRYVTGHPMPKTVPVEAINCLSL